MLAEAALQVAPERPSSTVGTTRSPPSWIRLAVRDMLERAPRFRAMPPLKRQAQAQAMVQV
jgi:hypothetical protein